MAFGDLAGGKRNVVRCVVLRRLRGIDVFDGDVECRRRWRLRRALFDGVHRRFGAAVVFPEAVVGFAVGGVKQVGAVVVVGVDVGVGDAVAVGVDIDIDDAVAVVVAVQYALHVGGAVVLRLVENHRPGVIGFLLPFEQGFEDVRLIGLGQPGKHRVPADFARPDKLAAVAVRLHDLHQGFFARAGGDDVAVHLRPAVVLVVFGKDAVGMVRERVEVALRARFVHALQKFLRADVTAIGAAVADGHAARQYVRLRVRRVRRLVHQLEQAGVMLRVRVGVRPAVAPEFVARLVPEFVIVDALRAVALDRFTEEAGEGGVVLRFGRVRARPVAFLRQFLLLRRGQVADVARPVGRAHDLHQHFHAVFLRQPDRIIDIAPVVAAVVLRLYLVPAGGDAHPFHAERGGAGVTLLNGGAVVARPARVERLHADAIGAAERLAADDEIHRRLLVVRAGVFFRVVAVGQRAARRIVTGQRQRALGIVDDRARLAGKVGEFGGV